MGVLEKEKYCSGALYIEVGYYLEVKFKAQLFSSDKLTYEPTLFEEQWPIFIVGDQHNVTDFADSPGAAQYKQPIEIIGKRSQRVSNSLFDMSYLDLKDGSTGYMSYDNSSESSFDISFTNKKFSYDPKSNTISVNVGEGSSIHEETDMRIVWKGNALAFSTRTLEKTVKIIWSDPANVRMIYFDSMGGSMVKTIASAAGEPVPVPADPIKQGYDFGGWYTDENFSQKFVFPSKMPNYENKSATAYAKWIPRKDTPYTVEHYIQNASGRYVMDSVDYRTGETDSVPAVNDLVKKSAGIYLYDYSVHYISPDGQSIMRIYYKVNRYDVTFTYGNLEIRTGNEIAEETMPLKYSVSHGSLQYAPVIAMPGYIFMGYKDVATGKPLETNEDGMFIVTSSETYEAQWTEAEDTPYQVKFFVTNPETNRPELVETVYCEGKTSSAISIDPAYYSPNYTDSKYSNVTKTGKNVDLSNPVISAFGDTVLEFCYSRAEYTLLFVDGNTEVYPSTSVVWGAKLTKPARLTKQGYSFEGWHSDSSCSEESLVDFNSFTMPATSTTLYANWIPLNNIAYKVEHYLQNANNNDYVLSKSEDMHGTTGTTVTGEFLNFEHYVKNEMAEGSVLSAVVEPDGSTVLKLYYDLETITIWFDAGAEDAVLQAPASMTYKYGQMFLVAPAFRDHYAFVNWVDENGNTFYTRTVLTMEDDNKKLTATWEVDGINFTVEHWVMDTNGEYSECTYADTKYMQKISAMFENIPSLYWDGHIVYDVPGAFEFVSDLTEVVKDGQVEKVKSGSTYFTDGMTIRLYYKRNKYSLSYVFEENQYSSILEGQNYTYGDVYYGAEIVKPNLQQTGMYTLYSCEHSAYGKIPFNGYEDLITMPDSDLIIHVYYSPCWYWLNYHYVNQFGGNQIHRDSKAIKYGTERSLELYASFGGFNRPGYSFIGWTTEENGTTVDYNDGETVINLADKECTVDLYPVWKPITVNISVKFYEPGVNGTMNPVSDTSLITNLSDFENLKLTCGTNLVLPEPIINRPGYFFEYWSSGDTTAAGEAGMKGWNNTNAHVTYDNVDFKELADGDTIYISGMISLKNYNINWNTCRDDVSVTFAYSGQKTINALIGKQGIQALNVVIDKRSVTTAANIYEFDGWYTKPEGKGYKQEYNSEGFIALYNVNDSSLYDISKFPEDIDLSSDGSTITFYANWIPTPCKYTVTVHPIGNMIDQSYGVLGFNYSSIEYTTQGYDKMYKTANIPDETLAAPKTMGELKGWAVYDEENRPVLDDRGKQVYWDGNNGLQNTLIDGKYKNINLYPDVDCNLWLFGQRVNTIEAMTKNYAPNTDGKATFDFKSTVLLLENCEITSSGDGLTNGNSNTYSLITSDIEGSLAIRVKGKNTMNINVNDNSREIAAIAAHKGKIDLRNLDGNQTNELIIKVKQEAESDKLVCGISVSSGYYQDMNLVDINIQGNALRNAGIKAEAKCYVYGELFIVIPYKEDNAIGAAIQVPVDHEINDNSAFTELHFGSDTKLALFGYRATQAILKGTFSNNVLTDSGEKDLDYRKAQFAHYYVMNFSENDVKWTEIQGYITDIKKLPSYRNLGIV